MFLHCAGQCLLDGVVLGSTVLLGTKWTQRNNIEYVQLFWYHIFDDCWSYFEKHYVLCIRYAVLLSANSGGTFGYFLFKHLVTLLINSFYPGRLVRMKASNIFGGGRHRTVDFSAPSILQFWVTIPMPSFMLHPIRVQFCTLFAIVSRRGLK